MSEGRSPVRGELKRYDANDRVLWPRNPMPSAYRAADRRSPSAAIRLASCIVLHVRRLMAMATGKGWSVNLWLGLLLVVLLAGCGRGDGDPGDFRMQVSLAPDPPQLGPAHVTVMLSDAQGQPIAGARVELEGNMRHAGMVPVTAQAYELAPGRYEGGLEFTMGGDWFILVRTVLPDGRRIERQVDVPGVDLVCGETP